MKSSKKPVKRAKKVPAAPAQSAKRSKFLASYRVLGNVSAAARHAGVSRTQHYEWMQDPKYVVLFNDAHEEACDLLEEQLRKSAMGQREEPVIWQGQLQYRVIVDHEGNPFLDEKGKPKFVPLTVLKQNDVANFFLLKAARPEKYRENVKHEITGDVNLIARLAAGRARIAKSKGETIEPVKV